MGKTTKSKDEYTIEETISRFLNLKITKNILKDKKVSTQNIKELSLFFTNFPYKNCYDQIIKNLAYFLLYDLSNFEERLIKLRQVKKNSKEWFNIQMGDQGYHIFSGRYLTNENLKNKIPGFRSSLAAKNLFQKIDQILISNNIFVKSDYSDPENNKHEFRIKDTNRWFCYDYTIKDLKIIIEYHGEHCHPKEADINTNWNHRFSKKSAKECFQEDQYKKSVAEKEGFKYYVIWHSSSNSDKMLKIKEIFEDFKIFVPKVKPVRKKYFAYELILPSGDRKVVKKLSDITKEYNISEYYIRLLTTQKIQDYKGYRINRCA